MTKEDKIKSFNPNSAGLKESNLFGLPFSPDEADVVIIPVPWEATVSYGSGAVDGPGHVMEASVQVDLYHDEFPSLWKAGVAMIDIPEHIASLNAEVRELSTQIIALWESGIDPQTTADGAAMLENINGSCAKMN
ncbi:MAG: arginase family protein, partial [Flavobacteriales bacterium]|nr:arginase family protein [Flavobacteriales bacterium]